MGEQEMSHSRFFSRRDVLQLGALGSCGLSLTGLLEGRTAQASPHGGTPRRRQGKARSCILIFHQGGPAHHATFDMKPAAPAEIRGEFKPISTTVPGYRVCEHLPRTARQAHRFTVIRSVHHDDHQHNNAGYATLTGTKPALLPNTVEALASPKPDNHPPFGAVLSRLCPGPHPWVSLPYPVVNGVPYPGQTAGFLGARYEPLWLRPDPAAGVPPPSPGGKRLPVPGPEGGFPGAPLGASLAPARPQGHGLHLPGAGTAKRLFPPARRPARAPVAEH